MNLLGRLHQRLVFSRRAQVLARHLSDRVPSNAKLLDVGCGSGTITRQLVDRRPDLEVQGIDVLVRSDTDFPVTGFDGATIPFPDASFDVVMFVDVLHHTGDPMILLREAARVARSVVVIKDHTADNGFDQLTLRFMDWVGNRHHGVALPYNYWSSAQWLHARESLQMEEQEKSTTLGLYAFPAGLLFDRNLHFIANWRHAGAAQRSEGLSPASCGSASA